MANNHLTDDLIDFSLFQIIESISKTASVSKTAAGLGVSQQAVSARLAQAERILGRTLIDRGHSGSTLTEDGRYVLKAAMPVLTAARRAKMTLSVLQSASGAVTIAVARSVAENLLPMWLRAINYSAEESPIRLLTGNTAYVIEQVREGEAQLGFAVGTDLPTDLQVTQVASDRLLLVAPTKHPWAGRESVQPEEVAATPLLVSEYGSGSYGVIERWFEAQGLAMSRPAAQLDSMLAISAGVSAGLAPGITSRRAAEADIAAGRLVAVPVDGPPLTIALTAVWMTAALPPLARQLIRAARHHGRLLAAPQKPGS